MTDTFRRFRWASAIAASLAVLTFAPRVDARADTIPASISDKDFWALTESMSEPNGSFLSDNMTSNEMTLSSVAAALSQRIKPGGVYLGVGPEQNLTYIAAIKPRIAFITDIRRGNLHMQLMYKALFELSSDRADFLSRLFTKKRPDGVTAKASALDLINAYWDVFTSNEDVYRTNLKAITDHLTKTHGFPLSQEDLSGIDYVYHAFYWHGLLINYGAKTASPPSLGGGINYGALMTTRDAESGQERSYLASEENFQFLKSLESKNLVVPVVGDFAGPKALRAVGAYLKDHGAIVSAFYVSNVEGYLRVGNKAAAFCANVGTMPLDDASTFIRPSGTPGTAISLTSPSGGGGGTVTTVNGITTVQFFTRSGTNTLAGATPTLSIGGPALATNSFFSTAMAMPAGALSPMASEVAGCK